MQPHEGLHLVLHESGYRYHSVARRETPRYIAVRAGPFADGLPYLFVRGTYNSNFAPQKRICFNLYNERVSDNSFTKTTCGINLTNPD